MQSENVCIVPCVPASSQVGLEKLADAEGQVSVMRLELQDKQPKLVASGRETAELIVAVELQTAEADKVKTLVQVRPLALLCVEWGAS